MKNYKKVKIYKDSTLNEIVIGFQLFNDFVRWMEKIKHPNFDVDVEQVTINGNSFNDWDSFFEYGETKN